MAIDGSNPTPDGVKTPEQAAAEQGGIISTPEESAQRARAQQARRQVKQKGPRTKEQAKSNSINPGDIKGQAVVIDMGSPDGGPSLPDLQLFVIQKESYKQSANIPSDPMLVDPQSLDSGGQSAGGDKQIKLEAIRNNYTISPLTFNVTGALMEGPSPAFADALSAIASSPGAQGSAYPGRKIKQIVDEYIRGRHLIKYASSTNMSSGIGVIDDLMITDFQWANTNDSDNTAEFTLSFQQVLASRDLTDAEKLGQWLEGGLKSLNDIGGNSFGGALLQIGSFAAAGAALGTAVFPGVGTVAGAAIGAGVGTVTWAIGSMADMIWGSLPWQRWQTPIPIAFPDGSVRRQIYDFEVWWNDIGDFPAISIGRNGKWIARDVKLVYGQDAFAQFQHNPQLNGIHLIPFSETGHSDEITMDNLQDDVQLVIAQSVQFSDPLIQELFIQGVTEGHIP